VRRLAIVALALAASVAAVSSSSAGIHAAAAPRCDVNDEHYTYYPNNEGAAGTMFDKFRVTHRGKRPRCSLRGYATVQLLGRHGKVLPIKVRHDHAFKVRTRVLRKGHPVFFFVRHPSAQSNGKQCTHKVYRVRVLLPHHSRSVTFKGFGPIRYCDAARVTTFLTRKQI
jgi:Protein of unknown function (DUF4232)